MAAMMRLERPELHRFRIRQTRQMHGLSDMAKKMAVMSWLEQLLLKIQVPEVHMQYRWQKRYLIHISMNRFIALFGELGYTIFDV